ncbi:MAG: hypothetical protein IPG97_07655 [Microthrixaceae bacterium]|nr:hypothetical protein [Microthrixaceae bacterium]
MLVTGWSFGYDGEHRVIRVLKPRHQPVGPEVVNSYDHQGRLHTQTDEAGQVTRFDFFTPGPGSTVVTFPSGRQRIDHYDTAGVIEGRTMAPGTALEEEVTYERDPVTLALEQVTSPAGVVVFDNDARGNRGDG